MPKVQAILVTHDGNTILQQPISSKLSHGEALHVTIDGAQHEYCLDKRLRRQTFWFKIGYRFPLLRVPTMPSPQLTRYLKVEPNKESNHASSKV